MAEHATAHHPQPGGPARRRDRRTVPQTGHHRVLEQPAYRGDSAVLRGWSRSPAAVHPHHDTATRPGYRPGLPLQVIEQVRRHHVGQHRPSPGQEPQEIQQVIAISTDRRRRELPRRQVIEEPVRERHITSPAAPGKAMTSAVQDDAHLIILCIQSGPPLTQPSMPPSPATPDVGQGAAGCGGGRAGGEQRLVRGAFRSASQVRRTAAVWGVSGVIRSLRPLPWQAT